MAIRDNLHKIPLGMNGFPADFKIDDSGNNGFGFAVERVINGKKYRAKLSINSYGYTQLTHLVDGVCDNYMLLRPDGTVFTQPTMIGSGGTGATSAADARENLGIKVNRLTPTGTVLKATNDVVNFAAGDYNLLLVVGRTSPDAPYMSMIIPRGALGDSLQQWKLADEAHFVRFGALMNAQKEVFVHFLEADAGGEIVSVRGFN